MDVHGVWKFCTVVGEDSNLEKYCEQIIIQ